MPERDVVPEGLKEMLLEYRSTNFETEQEKMIVEGRMYDAYPSVVTATFLQKEMGWPYITEDRVRPTCKERDLCGERLNIHEDLKSRDEKGLINVRPFVHRALNHHASSYVRDRLNHFRKKSFPNDVEFARLVEDFAKKSEGKKPKATSAHKARPLPKVEEFPYVSPKTEPLQEEGAEIVFRMLGINEGLKASLDGVNEVERERILTNLKILTKVAFSGLLTEVDLLVESAKRKAREAKRQKKEPEKQILVFDVREALAFFRVALELQPHKQGDILSDSCKKEYRKRFGLLMLETHEDKFPGGVPESVSIEYQTAIRHDRVLKTYIRQNG